MDSFSSLHLLSAIMPSFYFWEKLLGTCTGVLMSAQQGLYQGNCPQASEGVFYLHSYNLTGHLSSKYFDHQLLILNWIILIPAGKYFIFSTLVGNSQIALSLHSFLSVIIFISLPQNFYLDCIFSFSQHQCVSSSNTCNRKAMPCGTPIVVRGFL